MRVSGIPLWAMERAIYIVWANMFWRWAYSEEGMRYVGSRNMFSQMIAKQEEG